MVTFYIVLRNETVVLDSGFVQKVCCVGFLEQDIANVGTDEAVMKIARERLNLVEDGEMIFIDSDK